MIRRELGRERSPRTEPELAARLAFYAYLHDGSVDSIAEAVRLLDAALDSGCRTAPILAMRAAVANTRASTTSRTATSSSTGPRRWRGAGAGREQRARPPRAQLAAAAGQVEVAVQLAETAARLAPYQPFYLSTSGMVLIACGEWHRGAALIREAQRLQPGMSGQTYSWLAMASLVDGNYGQALAEASLLPADEKLRLPSTGHLRCPVSPRAGRGRDGVRAREMRPRRRRPGRAPAPAVAPDRRAARPDCRAQREPPAVPTPRSADVAPAVSDLRA